MKDLKEFSIPFVGLKKGVHYFDFEVDGSFFSFFENSPIEKSDANVLLKFEKKEDFFILTFDVGGTVNVACDRCLENFDMPFEGIYTIYVRYEENRSPNSEDEADVMYISRNETHLDISQLIYEFINLSLPIKKVHPDNEQGEPGCDKEVMAYLKGREDKKDIDPRWEGLENVKL